MLYLLSLYYKLFILFFVICAFFRFFALNFIEQQKKIRHLQNLFFILFDFFISPPSSGFLYFFFDTKNDDDFKKQAQAKHTKKWPRTKKIYTLDLILYIKK